MTRRDMLKSGLAAGATLATGTVGATPSSHDQKGPFKLKYGPHFGMFENHAGKDPVDQIKFAADEGFRGWEENGMKGFSVADQERIAKAMSDLKITMGVFVANGSTAWGNGIPAGKKEDHERFVAECKESVDVAKRVNAKWMTVVPGSIEQRMDLGYQTANVIDLLRRGAEVFEPHGLIMVLEPLNFRDHPNMLLTKVAQAVEICRAVNSPACKILNDMYHTQIHEGNIIPNIDRGWSEIAAFQIGDNPGRNEPGTGEMNYRNIFRHIHSKGFQGVLGMEHGISKGGKEGERALINAYRAADDF